MPVIFLSENNLLNKKVLKAPFSIKAVSNFEIPFKKMRKRARSYFKDRLSKTDALFFSSSPLYDLIPQKEADEKAFFNSFIIKLLASSRNEKINSSCRFVIFDPDEALTLSALNRFSDIALSGKNALLVANRIYEETGASLPIVSGCTRDDLVLCSRDTMPKLWGFISGSDIPISENALSGLSLKFYPKNEYAPLSAFFKRPLTLKEAALLSEYDKKATFNIAF